MLLYLADQDTFTRDELWVVKVGGPAPGPVQRVNGSLPERGLVVASSFHWAP